MNRAERRRSERAERAAGAAVDLMQAGLVIVAYGEHYGAAVAAAGTLGRALLTAELDEEVRAVLGPLALELQEALTALGAASLDLVHHVPGVEPIADQVAPHA